MTAFPWSRAKREAVKGKFTVEGVSGAGKTTAALLLAHGLCGDWGRVLLVDTENHRSLYAVGQVFGETTIGGFMHYPMEPPYSPARMSEILEQAETSGQFDVIIFDSFSKEWEGAGGVLEAVEGSSNASKFTAWKIPGEAHRRFIDAIQHSSMHVVCTMRSRIKYDVVEEERGGKKISKPVKRGLEPIQRAGTEYEFDVGFAIEFDTHSVSVSKDNTRIFVGDEPAPMSVKHGQRFMDWSRGADCQVGAREWVDQREKMLSTYGGTMDGLVGLWKQIATMKHLIQPADYDRLTVAKNAAKERIATAQAR